MESRGKGFTTNWSQDQTPGAKDFDLAHGVGPKSLSFTRGRYETAVADRQGGTVITAPPLFVEGICVGTEGYVSFINPTTSTFVTCRNVSFDAHAISTPAACPTWNGRAGEDGAATCHSSR